MNLPSNIGKSTLLAMGVFWTINFTESFELNMLPFILLSIIPICICVTLAIIITICPVFWIFQKENENNMTLSKRCFPYYIVIFFLVCICVAFTSGFEFYLVSFLCSAFITTAQSWVWFAKDIRE